MITVSPGSSRLLIPTSIPAEPVPETDSVSPSSVSNTRLSSSDTSSKILMKSGSRYPIIGVIMACRTRGCAVLGPGPSSMRGGTTGTSDRGSSLAVMRPPDWGCRARCSHRTKTPCSWAGPYWRVHYRLGPVECPRRPDDSDPPRSEYDVLTLLRPSAYNCVAEKRPPNPMSRFPSSGPLAQFGRATDS